MKTLIISLLWLTFILDGCNYSKSPSDKNNAEEIELPKLIGFPQKGDLIDTCAQLESISFPFNCIVQKGDLIYFNDTIDYHYFKPINNETYMKYWVRENRKNDGLKLYIDEKQTIAWKYWEVFPAESLLIEIDEKGNKIPTKPYQPPFLKVIKYPVYIYNSTDSTQMIEKHDGRLVLIQEALSKDNKWKAIEYFEYSGCGNSYGIIPLQAKSFLMFGINKYTGAYKTKMRVKLKTNGKIILSNEFDGYINPGQFSENKETIRYGYNRYLNK